MHKQRKHKARWRSLTTSRHFPTFLRAESGDRQLVGRVAEARLFYRPADLNTTPPKFPLTCLQDNVPFKAPGDTCVVCNTLPLDPTRLLRALVAALRGRVTRQGG